MNIRFFASLGMRPIPASIVRTLGWSAVYFGAAMAVNFALHTNFGYLRAKPEQPSLMDYMAPWPFYLIQLALLAIRLLPGLLSSVSGVRSLAVAMTKNLSRGYMDKTDLLCRID